MALVIITGHRNPDMDSIAAAISYARLKNRLEDGNTYVAAALGPLNTQSRAVLENLKLDSPLFVKDVLSRVRDVYKKPTLLLESEDPVYELVNMYNQNNPSVVPIMKDGSYIGLLSIDEINRYFLRENMGSRPIYDIKLKNIPKVIRGFFIKKGKREDIHAPVMVGAMDYKVFKERLARCTDKPVLVVGNRQDHINAAMEENIPGLILTGMNEDSLGELDFSAFEGFIYVSHEDTAETTRLFRLCVAVEQLLVNKNTIRITDDTLFESGKGILTDSGERGLPVFSHEDDSFIGFITRRCFLTQPRQKLIMVDHNEASQSVTGIEDADIIEIVDHHRLDAPKTRNPITIMAYPVGSTCTIIYDLYQRYKLVPEREIALLLLCGISSDTVMLKSPTTTIVDRNAVEALCKLYDVDYKAFCDELFSHGASLSSLDETKAVASDFKVYTENGVRFGIGQVEVTTLSDISDVKEKYLRVLEAQKRSERLQWAMLLVTNVMSEESMLICTDYKMSYRLLYEEVEKGLYFLPGVLSRKKQLLPEIIRTLS